MPSFLYGTAWKEDDTRRCVETALAEGFRGIDTANQRMHYHEAAVGEALARSYERGVVSREDLFLQTKFTPRHGQDHRLPYDASAPLGDQVEASLASSLEHLGTDYLDSYLLHGPSDRARLTETEWAIWRAIEALYRRGEARSIGVSNFSRDQLRELCDGADIAPQVVQNRCFARRRWDADVRALCREEGITYQAFSLLTANGEIARDRRFGEIAERRGLTPAQVVFSFALAVGMIPLTGTTKAEHMREDLACLDYELAGEDVELIENIAVS